MTEKKYTKESTKEELSQALHSEAITLKEFIQLRFEQIYARIDQRQAQKKS